MECPTFQRNGHASVSGFRTQSVSVRGTTATTTTEVSNVVSFTIKPTPGAMPVVTSLSASTTSLPATPYCGAAGLTLTVGGSNFASGSVVNWNGLPRTTTFVSATQLTASISPQDAAFPGTANVSVSNTSGPSNTAFFTMTTPMANLALPTITAPSQLTIPKGTPTFTIKIDGGVLPCTVAEWVVQVGGTPVTSLLGTAYVSANQDSADPAVHLVATIPAAFVQAAGSAQIVSFNLQPPAGGRTSNPIPVTISP